MNYGKRILVVNTVASSGSTGAAVSRQVRDALRDGAERAVIASGRGVPEPELRDDQRVSHWRVGSFVDAVLHYGLSRVADGQGRGSFLPTRAFVLRAQRFRPDTIYLHNLHGHYLHLATIVHWLAGELARGVRVVWTLHDMWPVTGHCASYQPANCRLWVKGECGTRGCPLRSHYPASLFSSAAANYSARRRLLEPLAPLLEIHAVSNWQARELRLSLLKKARISVCTPEIDSAVFHPGNRGCGSYILAAATNWCADKGLDDLIRIRRLIPSTVEMRVVGLNKRQRTRLSRLGITCLDHRATPAEMAELYRGAAVFINPTYAETYGLTNREALSCGTPVVTYEAGASAEGLRDHPSVTVLAPGSADKMAASAMKYIVD